MASILPTLPNDILFDILDHLPQKDLRNLALVSPRILGLAQRVLYRSIDLELWSPLSSNGSVVHPGTLHNASQLINTLSQNPHMRVYVSALSVRVLHRGSRVRFRDHESLFGLVPSLQSLSLSPPPVHFQLSNSSLSSVETLRLNFDDWDIRELPADERKSPIEVIAGQFWAPQLRKLHVDGRVYFASWHSDLFPPDRHRTSSVTDLQFHWNMEQDMGCLTDILLCIKSLECFILEVFAPWEADSASNYAMEPEAIGQCIRIHAGTLQQLEIAGSDAAKFPDSPLIGSLASYSRLKQLALPEPFLVVVKDESSSLVDVLPPNLEELQLQYPMGFTQGIDPDRDTRVKRLEKLAAAKLERFSALKRVILWAQPAECWDSRDGGLRYGSVSDLNHLASVFRKVGVKFEWGSSAFFGDTPFRCRGDDRIPWGYNDD
ncbi:hypothetical protein B0J14DRAFT_655268 [Halenospora varia]|nr:hypothetical protein B0J14DRAFT_655268 [Halenospora varia]